MTLVSLLEGEQSQLLCEGETSEGSRPEQNHTDVPRHPLAAYRQQVAHILEMQLIRAKSFETRPYKKKKSRSNKRKHKQT